jgi:hypothetical protein
MKIKISNYICFMLVSALLLINNYNSISLKKNLLSNKKDDNDDNNDNHTLDAKNPKDREKMQIQFKKYQDDIKEEEKKKFLEVPQNCVKFFSECNYRGVLLLTLCDKVFNIPRLTTGAETIGLKHFKSFKIARDVKLTMDYNLGLELQKPMIFFDNVECFPDWLKKNNKNNFEITIVQVDEFSSGR